MFYHPFPRFINPKKKNTKISMSGKEKVNFAMTKRGFVYFDDSLASLMITMNGFI